jgi:hypothetical protein
MYMALHFRCEVWIYQRTRLIAALRTGIARTGSTYFSCICRSPVAVRTSQLPELCRLSSSVNCQYMQRAPCCEICCRSCHFWVKLRFLCAHVLLLLIANQPICNFCILTTCKICRESCKTYDIFQLEASSGWAANRLPHTASVDKWGNEACSILLLMGSWHYIFFCVLYNDQRIWCLAKVIPWIEL